jgi:hypothetical protein
MTVYANVVNDEIRGVYDLIPKFWNGIDNFNISCQNDDNFMRENGFVKIIRDNTYFDPTTHRMSDFPVYTLENGEVYEHREISLIPPIISPSYEDLLVEIRRQRDQLMADFEWRYVRYDRQIRLGITPTDSLENLDAYMQALADVTLQEDLNNIVWPSYQE